MGYPTVFRYQHTRLARRGFHSQESPGSLTPGFSFLDAVDTRGNWQAHALCWMELQGRAAALAVAALAAQVVSFTAQLAISLISEPGKESDFGTAFAEKGSEPCAYNSSTVFRECDYVQPFRFSHQHLAHGRKKAWEEILPEHANWSSGNGMPLGQNRATCQH